MSTDTSMCRSFAQLFLIPVLIIVAGTAMVADKTPLDYGSVTKLDEVKMRTPALSDKGDLYVFMYNVASRESNNNDTVVNRYGYMGKYQFGQRTLWSLGKSFQVSRKEFLGNVALQDSAMVAYLRENRTTIQDVIVQFDGRWYNGVYITESGLLAGAHLVGPHGVRAFFYPDYVISRNGKLVRPRTRDGNGTSVAEYISKFSGYGLDNLN